MVYSSWVLSGKRDHYKHVLGGERRSDLKWTTNTKDYLDTPVRVDLGYFYNRSDSWFKTEAEQRLQTLSLLDDLPW